MCISAYIVSNLPLLQLAVETARFEEELQVLEEDLRELTLEREDLKKKFAFNNLLFWPPV